jgi:glycosyltransferase involved in cell wall biosynthesis
MVSVVLPTYNRAGILKRSIQSVLSQSYTGFELIIVDDASTDQTGEVVKGFDDGRIRYEKLSSNVGAAEARNVGIRLARGEIIAFQDSDDVWASDKLACQLNELQTFGDGVQVSVCSYKHFRAGRSSIKQWHSERLSGSDVLRYLLSGSGSIGTVMLLCRAEAISRIGGFDPRLPRRQDFDLCLRLASVGDFIFSDRILVEVYHSADSISDNPSAFLEATDMLVSKHQVLFEEMPQFVARHYAKAAFLFAKQLDLQQAKRSALNSIRWRPNARAAAVLVLSYFPRSLQKLLIGQK